MVRSRRACTGTCPTRVCRPSIRPRRSSTAAQYKQETGKDLTFTLSHTADPDTTGDAVLIQQMLKQNAGISISLNPVPDQSTLINIAIGRGVRRHAVA